LGGGGGKTRRGGGGGHTLTGGGGGTTTLGGGTTTGGRCGTTTTGGGGGGGATTTGPPTLTETFTRASACEAIHPTAITPANAILKSFFIKNDAVIIAMTPTASFLFKKSFIF